MDKKNLTIGVALLLAAFASIIMAPKPAAPVAPPAPATAQSTTVTPTTNASTGTALTPTKGLDAPTPTAPANAEISALTSTVADSKVDLLANQYVEIHLSNYGGAINEIALRKFADTLGSQQRFTFNKIHVDPMLGIVGLPGLGKNATFTVVSQSSTEIVYRAVFEDRLEVTRRYSLPDLSQPGTDPYQLRHETTFRNLTDQTLAVPRIALSIGTGIPLNDTVYGLQITSAYSDGKDQTFLEHSKLEGGGIMSMIGMGSKAPTPYVTETSPVVWASLSNQFFTSILTPDVPGVAFTTHRVTGLPSFDEHPDRPVTGLSAETLFDIAALAPGESTTLGMKLYVGPKEYKRLGNGDIFTADQGKVMNFGFFGFFSQILLTTMTWVQGWMHTISPAWAWGWAVVITTLLLKLVFLPLTLKASKSGKRMQKIQPEMKELKEKYKDNPKKMQAATMELFKKHKVNPMGGCLPLLITMPFFFGFYTMLRSAAELRFEPFLWATDLTSPDTVTHLFGFPLNIMPILMGITMVFQMRLTPQPTVDNAQAKIFKFMPWMFMLFCYNYSCALALYLTASYFVTIIQQLIINNMKDDFEPELAVAAPAGKKRVKNVTPKKKR